MKGIKISAIKPLLRINHDPDPYINRGFVYHTQGDYRSALNDYNLALSKDKNLITAINNIGLIKYEQGDITTALQQWQKSYELDNNVAETQFALAIVFYSQGDKEKAFQLASSALKLDKNFGKIDYLKENLWGEKIISDAQKLLSEPSLQK